MLFVVESETGASFLSKLLLFIILSMGQPMPWDKEGGLGQFVLKCCEFNASNRMSDSVSV